MYCNQCGEALTDDAKFCAACGSAVDGGATPALGTEEPEDWSGFFRALESEIIKVAQVTPHRFELSGEQKIKALLSRTTLRYQAVTVLSPATRGIQWWEKLSENSFGLTPRNFGISVETWRQKGTSVERRKTVRTPGGGYAYHYGDLRVVVEKEAARRGWTFQLLVARPGG